MARVTLRDYRKTLSDLLDAILVQEPVDQSPQYLTSAFLQLRRALLDQETIEGNGSLAAPQLADWLDPHVHLGPYERALLQRILANSHRGVVVVRGGSGSGKSSTFKHVVRQCSAAAKDMTWANRYGFRTFIHRIDLQATCEVARSMALEHPDRPAETVWHVLSGAISHFMKAILSHVHDDAAFVQLVKDATSRHEATESYAALEGIQAHLHSLLKHAGPHITRSEVMALLDSLSLPDALFARLLLLSQLARTLRDEDGRQLLIVIDNVDPLPVSLQHVAISLLASLVPALLWGPLCLVILARLSTAEHSLGVLHPFMIEHSSPDAADVVLYRLMWFFLFPDSFAIFKHASNQFRHPILTRLFELWRHLLDPAGYVRRILSAMAGTNLRNGLDFAKTWCLSEKFDTSRFVVDNLRRGVSHLYAFHVVSELDSSLARAVDALFDKNEAAEFARVAAAGGVDSAAAEWAKRFVSVTDNVLQDLHLACRHDDDRNELRHQVCAASRDPIFDLLNDEIALNRATAWLHLACSLGFERILLAVVGQPTQDSIGANVAKHTAARVVHALTTHLLGELRAFATTEPLRRSKASLIVQWIAQTIELAYRTPVNYAVVQRRFLLGEPSRVDGLRPHLREFIVLPSTSRFDAASILVDPGIADHGTPANALNVFAAYESIVCPTTLRLLYLLAKSKYRQLTAGELFDDLDAHEFTEDQIRAGFRQMARTEKRLLFAGLSDSNEDIERWLKPDAIVFLSSAGRRYYEELLPSPAYLQWAFNDIAEIRNAQRSQDIDVDGPLSLADRVHAAIIGFEVVVRQETGRFRRAWRPDAQSGRTGPDRRLFRAAEVTFQSPTADLFYRSYASFIHSLLSNVRRLRSEPSPKAVARAREVTLLLERCGGLWIREFRELFGNDNLFWTVLMDEAQRDVDEIVGRR